MSLYAGQTELGWSIVVRFLDKLNENMRKTKQGCPLRKGLHAW